MHLTDSHVFCYYVSCLLRYDKQEIWANAHETRDSITLISYAGCLGLSPALFQRKFTHKCASQPKIANNSLKTHTFRVQGRSRSSMLVPRKARRQYLLWYAASLSICNHSRARLVDSSRNRMFSRGYPNLVHSYGGLLEPRGSKLPLLKSTFNAEIYRLHVVVVYLQWFRRNSVLKCVLQPRGSQPYTVEIYV